MRELDQLIYQIKCDNGLAIIEKIKFNVTSNLARREF